jgi:peptidase M28-like protein
MMKRVLPFLLVSVTVVIGRLPAQDAPRPDVDPRIEKLVASVSEGRLRQFDEKLTSFGTRHTLSDQTSTTRGIGAARQWIFDEMRQSSSKLLVSFDTYVLAAQERIPRSVDLRNVMAVLPGRSPRRIYVTGHYDSVAYPGGQELRNRSEPGAVLPPPFDPDEPAPGANDDGSGTALTMELARVFAESGIEFDATLVFMCWAGEEQNSYGARAHAQRIAAEEVVVEANFNNDIVGNPSGGNGAVDAGTVRVYSEGPEDSMSRSLARYVERVSAVYVPSHRIRLMSRHDRFNRGSDHSTFNQHGYPAVVFRESNENWARQHSVNDTVDGVDFRYLAQNARVNAAGVASLALGPPAPKVTNERGQAMLGRQPTGYDANLRWNPAPGAVAYKIYWREAWTNDWRFQQSVGNVTQYVFRNVSTDDFVFGVAALGAGGQESLVSAYVAALPRDPEVKIVR